MLKILLQTVQSLLDKADDVWIDNQHCDCCLTLDLPPEDAFLECNYEDAAGLSFGYRACGEDNASATLVGDTLTLVGRADDGETYDFDVKLLKKWDAEAYLGEGAR
jgi:hypothetical protein